MTFLFCGELAELDVVRQNGEAELRVHHRLLRILGEVDDAAQLTKRIAPPTTRARYALRPSGSLGHQH